MTKERSYADALELLEKLIAIPSFSKEEDKTASLLETFFRDRDIPAHRQLNNIWAVNRYFDTAKSSILLNSHHDTVRPNPGYTKDPFCAIIEEGKLFGLGSNDAGGSLVSLIAAFLFFYDRRDLQYNLIIAATAEEEISGVDGIESLLALAEFNALFKEAGLAGAIVGEPTLTNLAIAEKGLLVLDCTAKGRAGHAAREEGNNALYKAMDDIEWFRRFRFPKISETLGPVKMNVTVIGTPNTAHNVIPDECDFVVDIRVTDAYTHEEVLAIISQHIQSEVKPRSMRLRSSKIDIQHPLVMAGIQLGKETYGSPTCSDAALINVPVLKCGPGDSARSHTADEFIYLTEIEEGILTYIQLLEQVILPA